MRPDLRGKPVGIVAVVTDSTCCIAASVEAKRFGVKTGTGVREAKRLCPGIEIVEARAIQVMFAWFGHSHKPLVCEHRFNH